MFDLGYKDKKFIHTHQIFLVKTLLKEFRVSTVDPQDSICLANVIRMFGIPFAKQNSTGSGFDGSGRSTKKIPHLSAREFLFQTTQLNYLQDNQPHFPYNLLHHNTRKNYQ